ncbi:MAG: DUF190 domain-containing protein [Kiritimatiellae bacterium]|nr:DUF190 domain-containing protein [Kiritimatiellia bacterium]MDW8458943.1 DUF190 domain-containing protein [Verrucomicrobiota bacterium]
MSIPYSVIEIFTSEEARVQGAPVAQRIMEFVRDQKLAARCIVLRGIAGCYENGEMAAHGIEVLSFNMPLKIEVILPAAEVERILPEIEKLVSDGIVAVRDTHVRLHRVRACLLPRHLRVRDAMTPDPYRARPDTPLSEILSAMMRERFGGVPVVDTNLRPVGIVTQGDLIRRAGMPIRRGLLEAFGPDHVNSLLQSLGSMKAADVMSQPVVTVREHETVRVAVDLMIKHKIKRLPVVDSEGRLVGIFSRLDVFRAIQRAAPTTASLQSQKVDVQTIRTAGDLIEASVPSVRPDTPLEEVIRLVDTTDVQCAAVVNERGILCGLITDKHLLEAFAEHKTGLWEYLLDKWPFREVGRRRDDLFKNLRSRTAADIMKAPEATLRAETPVEEAVCLMAEKGIKQIPVVDSAGRFLGMVTRSGLLRLGAGAV